MPCSGGGNTHTCVPEEPQESQHEYHSAKQAGKSTPAFQEVCEEEDPTH